MGSDPRRLDGLRADEQVAARLVERATGATARAHDVGRRQGAYDVHLTYPGGRTGALEVTTHAGAASRRGLVLLDRERLVVTDPRHRVRRLQAGLPDGGGDRAASGPVGEESSPDPTLRSLPDAVTLLLCVPHVARRVAKVTAARGVDERHLFVGIGAGALPDAGRPPTAEPAPLSGGPGSVTEQTEVPQGLTRVWVTRPRNLARRCGPGHAPEGWRDHPT